MKSRSKSAEFSPPAPRGEVPLSAESLSVERGAAGLKTLISRAIALDAHGSARLSVLPGGAVDVYVSTPFDCVASRRVEAEASRDGAVIPLTALNRALAEGTRDLGPATDAAWIGALPPKSGFVQRDVVPVDVVRRLADDGRRLARQFSGPLGPPKSLLDQTVLTVDADTEAGERAVEVPMRMIFTCTSLGLIPGLGAPADIPRHLRVSTAGRWVRMDAPFGSVYHASGLSLLL